MKQKSPTGKVCLLLIAGSLLAVGLVSTAKAETYIYARQYSHTYSNEHLLADRSGPTLKREYGIINSLPLPLRLRLNTTFILQASVQGLTDPPEQWIFNLEFERPFWNWLVKAGHGRQHNISRPDTGTPKGFGIARTYIELGYTWK